MKSLEDVDLAGKRVLVRSDLNVPLAGVEVSDDFRIRSSLPTIAALRERGALVIVASHLGRPEGVDPALSLQPVADRMSELAGFEVTQLPAVVGGGVEAAVAAASAGDVLLLENTRFEPGEKANDPALADGLANLADLFVLDAFGTAHRAHASVVGVGERIPAYAGPLLAAELAALDVLLNDPPRPFTVVLGGAKVSDKLGVLRTLAQQVDLLLIGGGMCFTALAAEGYEVGTSLVEMDLLDDIDEVLRAKGGDRISLPLDVVIAPEFAKDSPASVVSRSAIPDDHMGLDIGPETAELFATSVLGSGSVFWNGPMGVFEWPAFRAGTDRIAQAVAQSPAFSVVGGGDTVAAVRSAGVVDDITHVSTGGGAGLEYIEDRTLPAIEMLERWDDGS